MRARGIAGRVIQQAWRQQFVTTPIAIAQPAFLTAAVSTHFARLNSNLVPSDAHNMSTIARNLLVDTLGLMKSFEEAGLSRKQAEQLTRHVTEVICENKEKLMDLFASKQALEKSIMEQDAHIASLKNQVLKTQELHMASFTRDTDRLQNSIDKLKAEIKYEIDKLTASQRLDLNLEKGRMRDEMQIVRDKTSELEIKIDRDFNSLRAGMEQTKNETIKYALATMLGLITAGLGAARLLMH